MATESSSYIDELKGYLRRFPVPWTEDGLDELAYSFEHEKLSKGAFFVQDGQVCRNFALVTKGCLRYYILDEGDEKSAFFFPENYFAADFRSFLSGKPARCFIDALEDSELLTVSVHKIRELGQKHRDVETCARTVVEKLLVSCENRLLLHLLSNPEARYKRLMDDFGDLVNRVPQKHLASFLGITPVSLSRIRARMLQSS